MKKTEVAVKITDKNREKVRSILEMFGEKYDDDTKNEVNEFQAGWLNNKKETPVLVYENNKWIGAWLSTTTSISETIKPKQLKQILAKEHLKAGDVVVCRDGKDVAVGVFQEWDRLFEFDLTNCHYKDGHISKDGGFFSEFIRYATEEEKALLEPKKELEVGKWYKHANGEYKNWLVFNGVNEIYGFTSSGEYSHFDFDDAKYYFTEYVFVEATEKEVETALIKEAKKIGYKDGVNIKGMGSGGKLELKGYFEYLVDGGVLWYGIGVDGYDIFKNGKWAEVIEVDKFAELKEAHENGAVIQYKNKSTCIEWKDCISNDPGWMSCNEYRIKPEDKPQKGDVCKFWDDYEDVFVVGVLGNIDDDSFPYEVSGIPYSNAKKLTPEEVHNLLFK